MEMCSFPLRLHMAQPPASARRRPTVRTQQSHGACESGDCAARVQPKYSEQGDIGSTVAHQHSTVYG